MTSRRAAQLRLEPLEQRLCPAVDWSQPTRLAIGAPCADGTCSEFHWGGIRHGDLNGDGKLDLVAINRGEDSVSIFVNQTLRTDATARYGPRLQLHTGNAPNFLNLVDVNSDGLLDLAVSNGDSNTLAFYVNETPVGATEVQLSRRFTKRADHNGAAFADLDGDGDLDMCLVNREPKPSKITLYRNETVAGSTKPRFRVVDVLRTSSRGSRVLALEDLNRDGLPELLATYWDDANGGRGGLDYWVNRGRDSDAPFGFAQRNHVPLRPGTRNLAVGDVNGDGRPDVVVTEGVTGKATVLLQERGRGVLLRDTFTLDFPEAHFSGVAIADLNQDGRNDLLFTSSTNDRLYVLLRKKSGVGQDAYSVSTRPSGGEHPLQLDVADVNRDGQKDVAILNNFASLVTVYLAE